MTKLINESASFNGADASGLGLAPRRPMSPQYAQAVCEAAALWGKVWRGDRRAALDVQEALSTSDLFQSATGEVLDREMLTRYQDLPATWAGYAARTTVRDFRAKKMIDLLGGRAALDAVPELTEYPARDVSAEEHEIRVGKFGARFAISWESMINDDIDQLRDLPGHLAAAARDTESRTAAGVLTDGDGPNAALFNATAINGTSSNLLSGNPALTVNSLSAALTAISSRRDRQNRPIVNTAAVLVVPPALEVTARNILSATEIRTEVSGQTVIVGNWLSGRVSLVVDPWLPVLDTGANAATTWYLVPAPTTGRPAVAVAFLRGHEVPDLRMKADTGTRVGGGAVPAEDGSFDVDDIQYRVRHVIGGASVDPMATAASTGAGS